MPIIPRAHQNKYKSYFRFRLMAICMASGFASVSRCRSSLCNLALRIVPLEKRMASGFYATVIGMKL